MTIPLYYLSIRVTTSDWDDIHATLKLDEVPEWVAFPHTGKEGNNPHWHICIPTSIPGDPREADKYRKRLSRKFRGNQEFSVSARCNGMLAAIQYMSKEGTDAKIKGVNAREWIEQAPAWEHREPSYVQTALDKKRKNPDTIPQITYANMWKVCARWSARHDLKKNGLIDVLDHMRKSGEWVMSITVLKGGIPSTMVADYAQYILPKEQRKYNSEKLVYDPTYMRSWSGSA